MELKDLPKSELVRVSARQRVAAFTLGTAPTRSFLVMKVAIEDGRTILMVLAAAVAIHFAAAVADSAKRLGWTFGPCPDGPPISEAEYAGLRSVISASRVEPFSDALVWALQADGSDLVQLLRLPPSLALELARQIRDSVDRGMLLDVVSAPAPSPSRQ